MAIKENSKIMVKYRPELGSGEVIRVCEENGEYKVDVVFERGGQRLLETFPESVIESVDDIFRKFDTLVRADECELNERKYIPSENGV